LEYATKHGYADLVQEAGPGALSSCPLRVLVCAQQEGLDELVDHAAKEAISSPLQDAARILSAEMFVIWVGSLRSINEKLIPSISIFNQMKYYDQWLQVLGEVQKVVPSDAGSWEAETYRLRDFCKVYRNLADGPKSLRNLDGTFTSSSHTLAWKKKAEEMVAKVKSFSELSRGASGVS
jgi:hypothetical protein